MQVTYSISYADDTTLLVSMSLTNDNDPSIATLNQELNKCIEWLQLNALSLNVSKTKCMLFSTNNRSIESLLIKFNDISIDCVSNFDFLGVKIDRNLK